LAQTNSAADPVRAASAFASAIAAGEKSSPVTTAPCCARIRLSMPK
jgi:thiazole synthase ThiGH ThiG subunit